MPSNTALATSLTSARVGDGDWIIDSSIWVAVMTGRPISTQWRTIRFWRCGTSSSGQSIPRSPRATISASDAVGDRGQLGERGAGLDLGDDAGAVPDDLAELVDVVGPTDERQRDVVDARRGDGLGEHEVLSRRSSHLQPLAGQVDAWPTLCSAAALDLGLELGRRRGDDPHRDGAVAEHDPIAEIDVLQQRVVLDADPLRIARSVARHQRDDGSWCQLGAVFRELAGADLRPW